MSLPRSAGALRAVLTPILVGASLACAADGSSQSTPPLALYHEGITFADFLEGAESRRDTWHDNYAAATVPADLLARARALPGAWRMLVVAEDWCGDSANTIPYLARLVDEVDGLDMRIVDSEVGRSVMEAHPTPDGRAATPTVVLLDAAGDEAGCFVERPATLQEWFLAQEDALDEDDLYKQKYAWYDEDAGHTTIADVVEMVEAAASGSSVCRIGSG